MSMGRALSEVPGKLQQANALHQRGQLESARLIYEQILRVQPNHFDALHLLGVIAAQTKNPKKAAHLIARAIKANPNHPATYCNRATALRELQQLDAAVASYDKAIALKPDYALAYCNRANVLAELQRFDAALESYDRAIALNADFSEAHFNRGNLLARLRQFDAALASYARAIEIAADHAEAHFHRGNVLKELQQLDAAVSSYDRAVAIRPDYAEAHLNRGFVLKELHRLDEALASYDRAIAHKPDFAAAHFNRSTTLLLRGELEQGWQDYEWRWRVDRGPEAKERKLRRPLWLGKDAIAGKTILLHAEQGLGDTLQFCRYATLVADQGARVVLEAQESLAGLLSHLPGVSQVIPKGTSLPEFDFHCPLMSLPLAFNTGLPTIPSRTPYLRADAARIAHWQQRLGAKTRPRVGLAWSGNPHQVNDHRRSIRLADLMAHLSPDLHYVSLQTRVREGDRETLESNAAVLDVAAELHDFRDTAALCECMDLVITVDTSVAHLSGGLAKQTWVLLQSNSDWRWLLDRDDSPWYPSVKLYRQAKSDDWSGTLGTLGADLARAYGAP